jgi:type I restriction enzyme, S subunit
MKLDKVLTYQKGKAPQKDFVSDNLILYLTPEYLRGNGAPNFIPDFPSKVAVNDGDLLLLWDGSNAGEFFKGREGFLSSTMVKFRFNKEDYPPEFLFYQLKAFEGYLKSQTNGSGIPHVDRELLLGIEVEKFGKTEQTRIAQILSKADQAIEQTEKLIDKYQRIKTGLMQDLLTKGIDEKGNIRSEKTHRFKTEKGLRVPVEWEVDSLGVLCKKGGCSIQTGPFGSQLHAEDYKTEGVPIITVEHLIENRISHKNLPLVGKADYLRLRKYVLSIGDLVFSRVGSIDRCSITTEAENGWMFSGRCLRVTPGKYFDPYFLMYQLNYDIAKNYILANAVGSTMKCLNTSIISGTPVFRPLLVEQKKIADRILHIESFIQKSTMDKEKLQSLKTGLMQDLLSGKVRVKIKDEILRNG